MIHWLWTAFSTYILHSEHGNGYAWDSGGPGFLWIANVLAWWTLAWSTYRKHVCHVHHCPRISWHAHPDHGHQVCKRHHPHDPPRA